MLSRNKYHLPILEACALPCLRLMEITVVDYPARDAAKTPPPRRTYSPRKLPTYHVTSLDRPVFALTETILRCYLQTEISNLLTDSC